MKGEAMTESATIEAPTPEYPAGKYAKVEMMGHRTIWGRISEVERYGAKLLSIEPIVGGKLLLQPDDAILTTAASLYCLTPVSAVTAFGMAPSSVRYDSTLKLIAAPAEAVKDEHRFEHVGTDQSEDEDEMPF
jgi:hypothetical protein